MAARTVSPELRDAMKSLRLGQVLPTLAERITLAEKQDMPLEDFLLGILTDEVQRRQSASATRRADAAGLDPDMVFERWDKEAKVSYDRRVLQFTGRTFSIARQKRPPKTGLQLTRARACRLGPRRTRAPTS